MAGHGNTHVLQRADDNLLSNVELASKLNNINDVETPLLFFLHFCVNMTAHSRFPENLFTGSQQVLRARTENPALDPSRAPPERLWPPSSFT